MKFSLKKPIAILLAFVMTFTMLPSFAFTSFAEQGKLVVQQTANGGAITASLDVELPESDVAEALDAVCAPVSLYDPVYAEGGDPLTILDQVKDTRNTEGAWINQICLQSAFRALGDREKQILSLRFYDGKTQMEVATALGISQAQVSRLEKGAIKSMRKSFSVS